MAVVVALVVAEAAVVMLRPGEGLIAPASVQAQSYFSPAELDRARDFRGPQRALGVAMLFVEGVVLVWLVVRPPALLRRRHRRPLLAAAVAGGALSLVLAGTSLPLGAVAHQRAADVGLSTQSWVEWAVDVAKGWGIGALFAAVGAGAAIALMCRFPRRWWLPAAAVVVAFGVTTISVGPIVLDPLFNRFTPLPAGPARGDVLALARRAGVHLGEVYAVDASRRTTAANAYVAGLGQTKRVVLYDNLLTSFTRDELRLVVAHELAHVHHRDLPNGLLYLALVAPAGMLAAARLTRRLAPAGERAGAATVPALALSVVLMSTAITTISNQLSRDIEARADAYALRLTGAPRSFISFERRITLRNVSDPDPPAWATFLFATHPPTVQRLGIAEAFRRAGRPEAAARPRTRGGS